jgi:predicted nicotinamide N-methyase
VIELGSGSTGIPGIVALASGASHVLFCDIDEQAISELSSNLESNMSCIEQARDTLGIIPSKPSFSFLCDDWKVLTSPPYLPLSSSLLLLASEIVYDAVAVGPLVKSIHHILSTSSGSMIFCQSRHGRGKIQEFFSLMTNDPYTFTFTPLPFPTVDQGSGEVTSIDPPLGDDFIFGIFHH